MMNLIDVDLSTTAYMVLAAVLFNLIRESVKKFLE